MSRRAGRQVGRLEPVPRWQVVENVTAAFERAGHTSLDGLRVTQKARVPMRHGGTLREVDVLVEFDAGGRRFRLGVDVKHERRPLDLTKTEQLFAKSQALEVDRFVVVSTSGYTADALKEYAPRGLELLTLDELESLEWVAIESVTQVIQRIALTEVRFDYLDPPQSLVDDVFSFTILELQLIDCEGPTRPLQRYLERQVHQGLVEHEAIPADLPPGVPFPFEVVLGNDHPEVVRRFRIRGKRDHPLPRSFFCKGHFTIEESERPLFRFRYRGNEAFSWVLDDGVDVRRQQVLVREIAPDGTATLRQITMPADPPRTTVPAGSSRAV